MSVQLIILPILNPTQIPTNPPTPFPSSDHKDKKELPKITGIYPPIIENMNTDIQTTDLVDTELS